MVTSMSARVPVQDSRWTMCASSPTILVAKDGRPFTDWNWSITTSIPEAAGSGRNWDYRYCWLRDGYFVVNALNRLGATRTMERYLGYIVNVAATTGGGPLQPVYGIDGRAELAEREVAALAGYRGMGPVRIGNLAYRQVQHDVYGSAILAATHIFFDQRLTRRGDEALFRRLELLGEQAHRCYDQPDAGLWELRGSARVHTFSAVMCWAACDRLARIAGRLGLTDRATYWQERSQERRKFRFSIFQDLNLLKCLSVSAHPAFAIFSKKRKEVLRALYL